MHLLILFNLDKNNLFIFSPSADLFNRKVLKASLKTFFIKFWLT